MAQGSVPSPTLKDFFPIGKYEKFSLNLTLSLECMCEVSLINFLINN